MMEERAPVLRTTPKALRDFVFPLGVFAFSVCLMLGMAALTASSPFMVGEVIIPTYTDLPQLDEMESALLAPWQHWDGMWYLKIATHGYAYEDFSLAFFPAYPLLVRLVGDALNTIYLLSAVLVSGASYATGLVFVYKLARLEGGEPFARRSVLYLALFPTAFFFLAVYTESLFLAFTVSAFYFARKGSWAAAGTLGMMAALTRSTGLLLVVPFAIEYLSQRQFRLNRIRFNVLAVLLVPLGTAAYAVYNRLVFDDALGFVSAQDHWERSLALPWDTLHTAIKLSLTGSNHELYAPFSSSLIWQLLNLGNMLNGHAVNLGFFLFAAVVVALGSRYLRVPYTIYAALALLVPLCNPSQIMPLLSAPRFVLVLFPIAFVLARFGERPAFHLPVLASFVFALVVLTVRFAAGYWVA